MYVCICKIVSKPYCLFTYIISLSTYANLLIYISDEISGKIILIVCKVLNNNEII